MRIFRTQLRCISRTFSHTCKAHPSPLQIPPDYDAFCLLPAMARRGVDLYHWYNENVAIMDTRRSSFGAKRLPR